MAEKHPGRQASTGEKNHMVDLPIYPWQGGTDFRKTLLSPFIFPQFR
jgi:hypothetical protein